MSKIRVTGMRPQQAARHARKDRVLRYDRYLGVAAQPRLMDSFMLEDGRYACLCRGEGIGEYYQVYEGLPANIVSALDDMDHQELLSERKKVEHESFDSLFGNADADGEIVAAARISHQSWLARERTETRGTTDSRKKVLRIIMESLREEDKNLLKMIFDSRLSTEEIMQELGVKTKQALTNRKTRLLGKIRKIYEELGFEVPTQEQLREENGLAKEAAKARKKADRERLKNGQR